MTDTIKFPGLGLELDVNRVALQIGDISIYWYAVIIAVGFLLALLFMYKNAKQFGIDMDRGIDVIFIAMVLGIIGARAYFVAFQWDMYKDNLAEIFNIRGGGLGFYGGIIGGIIGIFVGCRLRKVNFMAFLDLAAGAVLIGQGIGRWGNFVNGECFGTNTTLPWGMTSANIMSYIMTHTSEQMGADVDPTIPVHPTFFYEFAWCMLGLIVYCLVMKKRRVDGEMFVFYIGWNGFGRMWIEGLRTDSLMIGSFRVSQLLGALMTAAAIVAFAVIRVRLKKAEAAGNAPTLWRDTEECRLKLEGKWDYKNNAPKEEEKKAGSEERAEGTGAKTNSQEPENETDSGENSFGEQ